MATTIRPLAAADEAEWRRLWTGYLEFYEASVSEEVYRTTFARLLGGDAHDYHGLIAEQDGKQIGLTHYLFHRHCWRVENVIYLQDLFVDPASFIIARSWTAMGPTVRVPLQVPNIAALRGVTLAMQAVVGPSTAPIGVDLSNGLAITSGR